MDGGILSKRSLIAPDARDTNEIADDNRKSVALLREAVTNSGLFAVTVKMALTGREYFVDDDGRITEGDDLLTQGVRMGLINKLIDRCLPVPRDEAPVKEPPKEVSNEENMTKWASLASQLQEEDDD